METNVYTPAQQVLLRMFQYDKSDKTANEIRKVLADYYQQKLDKELDNLWDAGIISQEKLDSLRHVDLHSEMKKLHTGNSSIQ